MARSIAFLNRAVAISSIVRVILRMLRTELAAAVECSGFGHGGLV